MPIAICCRLPAAHQSGQYGWLMYGAASELNEKLVLLARHLT
jgi:hypothetical protein